MISNDRRTILLSLLAGIIVSILISCLFAVPIYYAIPIGVGITILIIVTVVSILNNKNNINNTNNEE